MRVSAILLAAGGGKRFKSRVPKPLFRIAGTPLLVFSLEVFSRHPKVKEIVVVVNRANRPHIEKAAFPYAARVPVRCVLGGARRQDSVRLGLAAIGESAQYVLIHDSARPFIDPATVSRVVAAAIRHGAAIAAVPVKATIKRIAGAHKYTSTQAHKNRRTQFVAKTLRREELWEAQTPQVFEAALLRKAFQSNGGNDVTDDASLVEKVGRRVAIVMGSYRNIKITTPEDGRIAEALARRKHA